MSDELRCEGCGKALAEGEGHTSSDGADLCDACWKACMDEIARCQHEWDAEPTETDDGLPAHICNKCGGIFPDKDFPRLFGRPAPESAP